MYLQVACEDYEVVMQLEAALEDWTPAIASALETQLAKQPVGKGPLAEIEFWRARNAALSTLCEQLNTPNARRMLEVLERVESQLLSGFYGFYGELARDRTAPKIEPRPLAAQQPPDHAVPPHRGTAPRHRAPAPRPGTAPRHRGTPVTLTRRAREALHRGQGQCQVPRHARAPLQAHSPRLAAADHRHAAQHDERAAHGVGHLAPLQGGPTDGAPHGAHRVGGGQQDLQPDQRAHHLPRQRRLVHQAHH